MIDFGTVRPGTTLYIPFASYAGSTGASVTLTGLATTDIEVYKDGGVTQRGSDSGFALLDTDGIDFDGVTGLHGFSIDLADNTTAGFYAAGSQYWVVVSTVTIDSQTVTFIAATFRIGYDTAFLNTTIATLSTQTSFTLTSGPAEDDALNGCMVVIHDVASGVQCGTAVVQDYTGASKTVTLTAGTTFTAAATDNIAFYPPANAQYGGTVAYSTTRGLAGTALPAAAADAAGGLVISDAGGFDVDNRAPSATSVGNMNIVFATDFATNYNTTVDMWSVNVENWNTTAVPAEHTAGYPIVTIKDGTGTGEINTNAGAVALVDLVTTTTTATTATNVTTVNGLAANVITAASIAADAIGASELASDAVTEIRSLASGTSDSGTTTTMVDAARTEADDDYWKGAMIVFTSGNIAGQARYITGFTAATDTITFAPATTQAVSTQTYEIWPALDFLRPTTTGRTLDVSAGGEAGVDWANVGTPGSTVNLSATTVKTATDVETDTQDIQARLPAALVNSRMDCTIDGTGMETGAVDNILNRDASASVTNSTLGAIVNDWENGGRLDLIIDDILVDTGTTLQGEVDGIQADTEDIQTRLPAALTAGGNIKADALAIDGSTSAATNQKNAALVVYKGTCTSNGSPTTIVDTSLTQVNDHWNGRVVIFLTGSLIYQAASITDFDAATDTLTISAVTGNTTSGDQYVIV